MLKIIIKLNGEMMKRIILFLLNTILIISLLAGITGCTASNTTDEESANTVEASSKPLAPQQRLRVATTTSLYDTGLWGYLEPMFEEKYGVELDVLYAGTGAAIGYGERGDVDVIAVHSKSREEAFVSAGYGIERTPFAYNYFLIVGPADDPAGIKDMTPEEAFNKLYETGAANFISRGDDSGTHSKEKAIWQAAGYNYETVRESGSW
ncbi:MAG: substrate-binding domain-containing protein, partial [Dehalococcoidales bacterium]|nr:substrate-binding domain-containing protein [Dehalococcoidales bacterium]